MASVFTIGHSNLSVDQFLALLKKHEIAVVVDVRSSPYSAYAQQFNRFEIDVALTKAGFRYEFAGDRLGGKPEDKSFYTSSGKPDYDKMGEHQAFLEGLDWLVSSAEQAKLVIMCSESDAFTCHRERLIARKLRQRGVEVFHITSDGDIAVQEQGSLF